MKNYDLDIANCKGDLLKLNKLKNILYLKSLILWFIPGLLSKKKKYETYYLISAIYKELGLYKKLIKKLKTLFKKNRKSNFVLISLLSAIKKYGIRDNYYLDLIKLFNSRLENENHYYCGNSAKIITKKIKSNGFVILKDFLDKDTINELKNNIELNISNTEDIVRNAGKDPHNCIYPLYMISNYNAENIRSKIQIAAKDNWHLNKYYEISDISYINHKIVSLFKNSFLNEVISNYTNNKNWKLHNDYSMSRKISNDGFEKDGYAGLHQDSRLQLFYKHYLTFWIPFCKTGDGYAPTIDVIPTYCKNYYPYEYNLNSNEELKRKLSIKDFPKECTLSPQVDIGDVWIHDSFTLHGTSVNKNNFGNRHSIDLRFF